MALQAVEFDIFAFVEMRYRELGIDDDHGTLFDQAAVLRVKMDKHRANRFYAASLGSVMGVLGIGPLVEGARLLSFDVPSVVLCMAFVGAAGWLWRFWFQGEHARRFPETKTGHAPYEIDGADVFAKVLEPVRSGRAQLALISSSGEANVFAPESSRPIEKYVSGKALDDAWLPGDVLHRPSLVHVLASQPEKSAPEYVVVVWQEVTPSSSRPKDKWKCFYLWNLAPEYVATVFDRAITIYQDDELKRKKARFAVTFASKFIAKCLQEGKKIPSQKVLVKAFKPALKFEANRLLCSGDLDENQARMFERLGMSGQAKATDPAEIRAEQNDGSDGWFEQMLSGANKQILPALRDETLKDFPTMEEFKSK